MDRSEVVLVLLRGCHLVALASLFGTLVSLTLVAPAGLLEAGNAATVARERLLRLAILSCGLALLTGVGWAMSQAAIIAGATSIGGMFQAVASVLPATRFGHAVLVRFALLLVVLTLLGRRLVWLAMVLAGIALAMQGVMGH